MTNLNLRQINKILREKYGNLRLVHGKGYFYFTGELSEKMYDTSICQYTLPSIEAVIFEANQKLGRNKLSSTW